MNQNDNVLNQTSGFGVTEKYSHVKTQDVIGRLESQGFQVTNKTFTRPRKSEKQGFQKHMIRMTHQDLVLKGVGDSRPELVIVNSHDGSTSIKFLLGVFRLVCSNGLIVGQTFGGVSIRHVGDVWSRIDTGLDEIKERIPLVAEKIKLFQSIELNEGQKLELAKRAVSLVVPENAVNVSVSSALSPRRSEDKYNDLWTVFNRLQENALRGGIQYQTETFENNVASIRNNTTRLIKSIDRQVEVNKKLWDSAESFLKVG